MHNDAIVEEIHQIRAQLLAQHGGDFAAYFASLLKEQQAHPERYASFAQADSASESAEMPNPYPASL
jgi:hypothetical protein